MKELKETRTGRRMKKQTNKTGRQFEDTRLVSCNLLCAVARLPQRARQPSREFEGLILFSWFATRTHSSPNFSRSETTRTSQVGACRVVSV